MIKSRNRNIVIKSQFNIHGSRGKDVGKFIADYVSRESATDPSMAYRPDPNRIPQTGDGVAFTLDDTAITRQETLDIAEHVQNLHATGTRAIQQMVISLDPDYLIQEHLVPEDIEIHRKGDYRNQYDDVRLRHAVRHGLQSLIDVEGYRDGKAVACIQRDTNHLHVHAVVYEDAKKISRVRGREEKGVIKKSSFNLMAHDIDRYLEFTKMPGLVPNVKNLVPEADIKDDRPQHVVPESQPVAEPVYVNAYLQILQQKRQAAEEAQRLTHKIIDKQGHIHDDRETELEEDITRTQHENQEPVPPVPTTKSDDSLEL